MPQPSTLSLIRNAAALVAASPTLLQRLEECRALEMERVRLVALRWHASGSEVRLGLPVGLYSSSLPCTSRALPPPLPSTAIYHEARKEKAVGEGNGPLATISLHINASCIHACLELASAHVCVSIRPRVSVIRLHMKASCIMYVSHA